MPFTIVHQDITKMKVDAIVNASNTELAMGGGVCGAIYSEAGIEELTAACSILSPIPIGTAVITPGFKLPCKYIIHAVGPVYDAADTKICEKLLTTAYTSALELAREKGCTSIAFPLISSGIYGYPKEAALKIASKAIRKFLNKAEMDVYLVVFDKESFAISEELVGKVASYIDDNYIDIENTKMARRYNSFRVVEKNISYQKAVCNIMAEDDPFEELVEQLDEPFNITLLRIIDKKGKSDVEVYKKANIDRKLFSKIRTGKGYMPSKRTAIALAISLELTLPETEDLLKRAGYSLSHSQKFDVIIEYFISHKKYDIFEINDVLFKFDQPLLGV